MEKATLAGGCFWCTEAIFQRLKGVIKVTSGYTGGQVPNPTYEAVCTGVTGHAESIEIEFDPTQISYENLIDVFFHLHDPTTLNRQGADTGTQYRSAIFYHSKSQQETAEKLKNQIPNAVTEIVPASTFYPAENYHQNYFNNHASAPYCSVVISPKIKKLLSEYRPILKN